MSGIERVAIAVSAGLVQAVVVWIISTVCNFPRVWPGTVLVFAMGTLNILALMPRGGRR